MPTILELFDAAGVVEAIDADAVRREAFSYPAEVTSAPVERGVEIVDHVRPGPISVELELVFSEYPLAVPLFGSGAAEPIPGPLIGLTEPVVRAGLVADRLRRAQERGELSALASSRRGRVERLVVVNVAEPYEAARGAVLSVSLRQVRIAEARFVAVPAALLDLGRKNRGRQPGKPVPPVRRASLLSKLSGYGKAVQ